MPVNYPAVTAADLPPRMSGDLVSFAMGAGGNRNLVRAGQMTEADALADLRFDMLLLTDEDQAGARQILKAFFPDAEA